MEKISREWIREEGLDWKKVIPYLRVSAGDDRKIESAVPPSDDVLVSVEMCHLREVVPAEVVPHDGIIDAAAIRAGADADPRGARRGPT